MVAAILTEKLAAIVVVILFSITDGFSDAWIFRDFRERSFAQARLNSKGLFKRVTLIEMIVEASANYNTKWHRWQFARQGLLICFCALFAREWCIITLGAACFWLVHDGIVNLIGLKRPFFYVGTTSAIDRFFGKFPNPPLAIGFAKFLLLGGSLFYCYAI